MIVTDDPSSILEDLIRIPSVSPDRTATPDPDLIGESRVNEYLADFIKGLGLDPFVQQTRLPGRENVGAVLYKGDSFRTVVFQSHTDTVGLDEDRNLLRPVRRDGRIYGRGACDDKGALAAMFSALSMAVASRESLANNVIVMGVSDEEAGGSGSLGLLSEEPTQGADFGIVGEPTSCRIVNGSKGTARWDLEVRGRSVHSSEPRRGVNAVYRMAHILSAIEAYGEQLARFDDPPLGPETISVGRIEGGISVNVVPDRCRIETICRALSAVPTVIVAGWPGAGYSACYIRVAGYSGAGGTRRLSCAGVYRKLDPGLSMVELPCA